MAPTMVRSEAIRLILVIVTLGGTLGVGDGCSATKAAELLAQVGGGDKVGLAASTASQNLEGCELWEVSTRELPRSAGGTLCHRELSVWRYFEGGWQAASECDLHSGLRQRPLRTILFVHGNRTSRATARYHALLIKSRIEARSARPVRLICWSWPSEKPEGIVWPAHLVSMKKELIRTTGVQLSDFLQRTGDSSVRALIGFSFGCVVISQALHTQAIRLSDGSECVDALGIAQVECRSPSESESYRIGFLAPAMDRCALEHNGEYGRAMERVESLVNLYNSRDPILRRFRFFDRQHPTAAGYLGLNTSRSEPLATQARIVQYDCRCIGCTHALSDYYRCPAFDRLLDHSLGEDSQCRVEVELAQVEPAP